MKRGARGLRKWQLRLSPQEDAEADRFARRRMVSKNDLVRYALRLLMRLERESEAGGRLLIERPGTGREPVEVWLLW